MNIIVSDLEALFVELRAQKPVCIGVDGIDGVGKSETSTAVGSGLGVPVIHLDDFVEKNQGGYVAYIDYPALASRIANTEKFLVEGVCLLEVLERLGIGLDCLIYVKRMSSGVWADENECEFPIGIEEAIRQSRWDRERMLEFEARQDDRPYMPSVAEEPNLGEEIMRYHAQYSPHLVATITFCKHIG